MQEVEIRLAGHLDSRWEEWLGDVTLTHLAGEATLLTARIQDQAALYGLIAKLRDLGVKLVSVSFEMDEEK